ncbi:MAG: (d)CMP kinase [Bacillota bacterium]|nr:(d)CMP kinase [Bacillota bacterium]
MQKRTRAIAIDGPSGAGKSTVAKAAAKKLGFQYIDTGAMYRAVTLGVLQDHIPVTDERAVVERARHSVVILKDCGQEIAVSLDGEDVSEEIRGQEVTANVSAVCSYGGVREAMVSQQRAMAQEGGVVMDGRDICSHVLPNAMLKIFMTASAEERGRRRHKEWQEKGIAMSLEEIIDDINRRDHLDSTRALNPLCKTEDSILLETDGMTIDQVVEVIVKYWQEVSGEGEPSHVL